MNILRTLAGSLGLGLLLTTTALAQQPDTVRVTGDRVNVRNAPSIDSAIVRTMSKGTLVTIVQREGAWARVQAPSGTGWVRSSTLSASVPGATMGVAPEPTTAPAPARAMPATAPMARVYEGSSEHTRFTIFGGMALNQGEVPADASRSNFLVGLSLLFPAGHVLSIGPELTYFHNKVSEPNTISGNLSSSSDAGSASLMFRAHSRGSVRLYAEAGPTVLSSIHVSTTVGTVTQSSSHLHAQGGLTGGAGLLLGPIALGAHYQRSLATGGGHLIYFSAGLTF